MEAEHATRVNGSYKFHETVEFDTIEITLPHGHRLVVQDCGTDVAIVMYYPNREEGVALESVMK